MKTKTSLTTKLANRSPWRPALLLISIMLVCFALTPQARAVCQQGCVDDDNTVLGDDALISLDGGLGDNTAIGSQALRSNTLGSSNTAIGFAALEGNTFGQFNTAIGNVALFSNTTGIVNTAIGNEALPNNTTGSFNTANGLQALLRNTTGSRNIALGALAGRDLTTGNDNIDIGNTGVEGEANTIRIGTQGTQTRTFIAGIRGVNIGQGVVVEVDASGELGTRGSSQRFKEAIKPMDKASEAVLSLKPVTFRYKKDIDPASTSQFGLVAEDVEKVNPDLVARDDEGKPYTVRYEAVNAMLLNEFLKEHRTVEEQGRALQKQAATIAKQQKQIEALTAGLQKVSAQVEMTRTAPQMVVNDQ